MQNPISVYVIQWLPPGVVADPSQPIPDADNVFIYLSQAIQALSGTSYLNIASQYPENCGQNKCVLSSAAGAVQIAGSFTETQAYPRAGTQSNPLIDSDIQNEIAHAVAQKGWNVAQNSVFVVMTGALKATSKVIEECQANGVNCTFKGNPAFCAYHSSMGLGNGLTAEYIYLSDASFNLSGCNQGIATTSGVVSLAETREIALLSHEFMETVTDPIGGTAWVDSISNNEIGDNCNQIPGPSGFGFPLQQLQLQQEWSNASSACVSALPTVTRVSPSSGPNTGGTNVEVDGALFDTGGGTQINFGGPAATNVKCPSSTQCFATSPSASQTKVNVTATVKGLTSDPTWPQSIFTYNAGPLCTSSTTCPAKFGFPELLVQCPSSVNFYQLAGTPYQEFVGSGTSYAFDMDDTNNVAEACANGSCTSFSLYEGSPTFCGSLPPPGPNFCKNCKANGGVCTTGAGGRKFCIFQ